MQVAREERVRLGAGSLGTELAIDTPQLLTACGGRVAAFAACTPPAADTETGVLPESSGFCSGCVLASCWHPGV